ncbi:MAG: hypothetical protein K6E30_05975 [Lachnospiraceae bacterium]|nr:hypothetical protein [Lachnospiraceae bacterium]
MGKSYPENNNEDRNIADLILLAAVPILIAVLTASAAAFIFFHSGYGEFFIRMEEEPEADESAGEAARVLPLVRVKQYSDAWYAEEGDTEPSVISAYETLELTAETGRKFRELASSLRDYSSSHASEMRAAYIKTLESEIPENALYFETLHYSIKRADRSIFSFSAEYAEKNQQGESRGTGGAVFDSETGRRLVLGDIVRDRAVFCDRIACFLFDRFGSGEFLFQTTARLSEALFEKVFTDGADNLFSLDPWGITVYIPSGVIAPKDRGLYQASLLFAEEQGLFSQRYTEDGGAAALELNGAPLVNYLDVDYDGGLDRLEISGIGEAGAYSGIDIGLNADSNFRECPCTSFSSMAVRTGTETFLYLSVLSEEGNRLLVFNLTDGEAVYTGEEEGAAFTLPNPGSRAEAEMLRGTDPGEIWMVSSMNALGNYEAGRNCHPGKNGMLVPNTVDYMVVGDRWLSARKKLRAEKLNPVTLEPTAENVIVPEGAYMKLIRTDNVSYVDFRIGESTCVRLRYGAAEPQSVNGETASELLSGIIREQEGETL